MRKHKNLFKQILRFSVVGGSAFLIDYSLMLLLVNIFGLHFLPASTISFLASTIYNYILSVRWVFQDKKEQKKAVELTVFVILSALGLLVNEVVMWLSTHNMGIDYRISKLAATFIVMIWNFISRKLFLENRQNS